VMREPLIWEEYFDQIDWKDPEFVQQGVPSAVSVGETRTSEGEPKPKRSAAGTHERR
jgi:hypothetical protein